MAVPHYNYLVLKMPSPAGVLSLQGDLKISHDCDTEAVEIASKNQVPNAMMEIYTASKKLAPSELDIPEKSDKANKPQPAEEVLVKIIDLGTGDSSKTTTNGAGLNLMGARVQITREQLLWPDLLEGSSKLDKNRYVT
jgi:hypothetical protein